MIAGKAKRVVFGVLASTCVFAGEDSDNIIAAGRHAESCDPLAIASLFALSEFESTSASHNATNAEALAGANEGVFLACPVEFLNRLKAEDQHTQKAVAHYFALFEVEQLKAAMSQFASDPRFSELTAELFADLIEPVSQESQP